MSTVHVLPVGDVIEHEMGGDCPCGPTVALGDHGWVSTHHSLGEVDGVHRGWIVGTERETA